MHEYRHNYMGCESLAQDTHRVDYEQAFLLLTSLVSIDK